MADLVVAFDSDTSEDAMKGKYLLFPIGENTYGIPIRYVVDIIEVQKVTSVPDLPNYMKGIVNLRGTIVPVVDIRTRFHREEIPYTDRTCLIVVGMEGMKAGLVVDTVSEVLPIDDNQVMTPPQHGEYSNQFVFGIGKTPSGPKLLLDCHRLFGESSDAEVEGV